MKAYRATIQGDRYPVTVDVSGSSWAVAANRAVRLYQARLTKLKKHDTSNQLTIKLVKEG